MSRPISCGCSSSGSSGSRKRRRASPTTSGTSMPRPRPTATTPRRCATIVRLRKMETHTRQEADALLETYRDALGLRVRNRHHGRPFQIQEHHAPQGRAGQKALGDVLQAQPRNHRRGEDGPARSGHERAAARRGPRRQGAVDAQGQYPALDRQGLGRRRRELRGDPLRGLRPRRRRADRRGADRQPQPHRHQRPHRSSPRTAATSAHRAASATASSAWA